MKIIYNYHPATKQYLQSSVADESPLEKDVWLYPAFSTDVEPLSEKEDKIVVFNEEQNIWEYREIHQEVSSKSLDYKEMRIISYPSIGDQLDALFKAGLFPEEMSAQIQTVKDKYPKV